MWYQLLTDTKKIEVIFTNPLIISESPENHVRCTMKKYKEKKFHLYNTALTNFYYSGKIKDHFETNMAEASFEYHNITILGCQARIEHLKNIDCIFNTLFGNTCSKYVFENETKPAQCNFDGFDIMRPDDTDSVVVLILPVGGRFEIFNMFTYYL